MADSPTPRHSDSPTQSEPPRSDAPHTPRSTFLLERVIEASSRNTFLILILTIFGIAGGLWALRNTPLDAIPDLSDVQVIITTDWEGRSPDLVEDQVTYPISTRFIELGRKFGDDYQVRSGLKEGERVVASANFLIDAEAKVQGALQSF